MGPDSAQQIRERSGFRNQDGGLRSATSMSCIAYELHRAATPATIIGDELIEGIRPKGSE